MEKLVKAGKIKLAVIISLAVLGILSLVGIALFSLKLLYAPLIICIVIAIAAIYAVPLLIISRKDGKLYAKILAKAEEGITSEEALSAVLSIKPSAFRKIIAKGIKKGYISADKITA